MPQAKIHVYFMPGLAAGPGIFEFVSLPQELFEMHYMEWFIPDRGMSIEAYARELSRQVVHKNPVLIGVSFGGLLVQEMAQLISVRKVIIISSIKQRSELPRRLIFAKYTRIHKLLPTGLVNNVELLSNYSFGESVSKRLRLYEQYLSMKDKYYLDWAIDQVINWKQTKCRDDVIHIHGEKDAVPLDAA
jgi:pimeloyl-ACP methyl ester carboxylesterase